EQFFARHGVAKIKLVRADDVAFTADAEEFWFDGIQIELRRDGLLENGVERFGEAFARGAAVGGRVFVAIGNPDVGDARRAERVADERADFTAADAVFNPEFADGFVAVRERETVGSFRVREKCRVEIHPDSLRFSPRN